MAENESLTTQSDATEGWAPFTWQSPDGLALFGRDYAAPASSSCPVLCLPGLTRNSRDFHDLAMALSHRRDHPRRVLALEFRGRGRSAYDSDWQNYTPQVEAGDVIAALDTAGLADVMIIGTSRGGLVGMILGAMVPHRIRALALNDIGPVIDPAGLSRIKAYVTAPKSPQTWTAAANALEARDGAFFPNFSAADWMRYARQIYNDVDGRPSLAYDTALGKTMADLNLDEPIPDLWPVFELLDGLPMLAIRGALSDLLSEMTLAEMAARHSGLKIVRLADQGHAPPLWEPALAETIAAFLDRAETVPARPAPRPSG